jgi:hypothetical protein
MAAAIDAARRVVDRAQPWSDRIARVGYVARGAVFLMVGGLALAADVGVGGGKTTDPTGAMLEITRAPAGRLVLGAFALGLLAHAAFRAMLAAAGEAYIDRARSRWEAALHVVRRTSDAVITLVYLGLAATAAGMALGAHHKSATNDDDRETQSWSARLLHQPFGRALLLGVAGVVLVFAIVTAVRAFTPNPDLSRRLRIEAMSARWRVAMAALGRIAFLARACVFGSVAVSLGEAALRHSPGAAHGSGGALRAVRSLPGGTYLLALVAGGLVAFGVYGLCEARWRRLLER